MLLRVTLYEGDALGKERCEASEVTGTSGGNNEFCPCVWLSALQCANDKEHREFDGRLVISSIQMRINNTLPTLKSPSQSL